MHWAFWGFVLVCALYVAAFGLFAWRVVGRTPLYSFGWALLGCLSRWLADYFVLFLFIVLTSQRVMLAVVVGYLAIFRFAIWATLAYLLYHPTRKQSIHFALVMTLVNFGIDLAFFGAPAPAEYLKPIP
jgi:hypothetical protein